MIEFTQAEKVEILRLLDFKISKISQGTDAKISRIIGIDKSNISNMRSGKVVVSEPMWLKVAEFVQFSRESLQVWKHANTQVSRFLFKQFDICQAMGLTAMMADDPGIGKTHSMREYEKSHSNVVCIDGSVNCSKANFIRAIAKAVGVGAKGRLNDLMNSMIYAISLMDKPLIIIDEAGDLDPSALLQLKKLYNALELKCGFYLMGSDGFKSRIKRGVEYDKLGFTEVYSRFDKDFKRAMSANQNEKLDEYKKMAVAICQANGVEDNGSINKIVADSFDGERGCGDLRRVKREVFKYRMVSK